MTGKEALFKIASYCPCDDVIDTLGIEVLKELKLEALEAIEILKKIEEEVYKNGGYDKWNWFVNKKNPSTIKLTEKEVRFLKEWLENEK